MATLLIRDLRDDVKAKLRIQAAEHGHSMEAEARALLTAALIGQRSQGLGTYIHQQFADIGGVELDVPTRAEAARTIRFDG